MRHYFLLGVGVIILILVGYLNILAFRFHWYWSISWSDMPMHFFATLGLALVLLGLAEINFPFPFPNREWRLFVSVLFLVLLISCTWELFEFTTDRQFGNHLVVRSMARLQQGAFDTSTDLLSDLAGAIIGGAIFYIFTWQRKA